MSNKNDTMKMVVFISLATFLVGAIVAISFTEEASTRKKAEPSDQAQCHRTETGSAIGECASSLAPGGP